MSSRSCVLDPPTRALVPPPEGATTKILDDWPDEHQGASVTNHREALGGGADALPLNKIIPLLSPEHRRLVEAMVRELAKIEGLKVPATTESVPEPLGNYIPAWQNSLNTRGFSPGSMALYLRNVEHFLAKIFPPFTTIAIEGYAASRRQSGLSPNALKNELKAIKSFFSFLFKRKITTSNPAADVEHPKIVRREKVCPTPAEMAKFLTVLALTQNPRAKLMMALFINTGIRFNEMVTLTWGKVDLAEGEIAVLGKGNKWRRIPTAEPVRDFLADLRDVHSDDDLLFPTESKKGKWDNSDANRMIARLCRRAGIKRYSCHQFRHYFATYALKLGARLKVVQELLGHESAQTTLDFYDHTDDEEIRKTHEAFAPLLGEVLKPKDKGGSKHGQTT